MYKCLRQEKSFYLWTRCIECDVKLKKSGWNHCYCNKNNKSNVQLYSDHRHGFTFILLSDEIIFVAKMIKQAQVKMKLLSRGVDKMSFSNCGAFFNIQWNKWVNNNRWVGGAFTLQEAQPSVLWWTAGSSIGRDWRQRRCLSWSLLYLEEKINIHNIWKLNV